MEPICLLETVPDAFLALLQQFCVDSRNDSLSSIAKLIMASTVAKKLSVAAIQKLDFSYMAWYGLNKDFYPALKISSIEPIAQTLKIQRKWGQARRAFFLRHLILMPNLRSLNLSGMAFPTDPTERHLLFSTIGSLPALRELRLANVTVLFSEDFAGSLLSGKAAENLRVLDVSGNHQLGTTVASAIGQRCPNLEELYWAMTDFHNPSLTADSVMHFKKLCSGCRRLRKFIAPGFARKPSEWLAELESDNMELLGLVVLRSAWNFPWSLEPSSELLAFLQFAIPRVQNDINRIVIGAAISRRGMWIPIFANVHSIAFQQLLLEHSLSDVEAKVRQFVQTNKLPQPSKPLDWNMANSHGLTTLALAASDKGVPKERFIELRDAGVDPTKQCGIGFNPFVFATLADNVNFLSSVEEYLAGSPADAPRVDTLGFKLLHAYMLFSARRKNTAKILEKLSDYGIGINDKDMFGYTALHYALLRNHQRDVRLLLAKGSDMWIHCDIATKDSPIQIAIRYGCHSSVFKALLPDEAALENALQNLGNEWRFLLILFVQRQDLLRKLILSPRSEEELGALATRANAIFPIYVAASRSGKKLLCTVLSQAPIIGAVSINEKISTLQILGLVNGTALHLAAQQNRPAIVRALLDHGADTSVLDGDGRTPLMVACKHRAGVKCVPLLLERMVKMPNFESVLNQAESGRKYTALHWTSTWQARDADVLRQFLKTPGLDMHAKDADSRTILDWLVKHRFQYYRWDCKVKPVFVEMGLL